jgi:hypothetical protein
MAKVLPGELVSVTNHIVGFLRDLTPDPDGLEEIIVDEKVLTALMVLASAFTPKNDDEAVELAYDIDSLKAMKEEP